MSETTGSSMAICAPLDRVTFDPHFRVPVHCHAVCGKHFFSPYGEMAGMVLKWFRDNFGQPEVSRASQGGCDAFELLGLRAADVPAGSEGLVHLPFLSGAGAPEFDPGAKGVFYGFDLRHTKGHFVRAIMESIAYVIARNVQAIADLDVRVDDIRCLGGGARSDVWCQIKADVLQTPVAVVEETEQALKGAAILAGVGAGIFGDIEAAGKDMVSIKKRYEPNRGNAEVYAEGLAKYEALYAALKPVFQAG
jgi:xylulokinase